MSQLYHPAIHDYSQTQPSYWEATAPPLAAPADPLAHDITTEVAIVGGGYTGLSAALHLARDHGIAAVVLEAGAIGWGASGRNGGFCCLGSSKLSGPAIVARYGPDEARAFFKAQTDAIRYVPQLAADEAIELEATGEGELVVAHKPGRLAELRRRAEFVASIHGENWQLLSREALAERALAAEESYGALLVPYGFGIHPLRYVRGLAAAATRHGAVLHANSEVTGWECASGRHRLTTRDGTVTAGKVLVATNGFYREGLDIRLDGRFLPALSSIVVTRPLTAQEQAAHRWSQPWLVADTRKLLFYLRLLPDGRLLFGSRGGTRADPVAFARRQRWLQRRLADRFPAWREVETTHAWWGLVCLAADRLPHLATLDDDPTTMVAGAYHGAGVAMGTWFGRAAAARLAGRAGLAPLPSLLTAPPPRFAMPSLRLWLLRLAYAGYRLHDELA